MQITQRNTELKSVKSNNLSKSAIQKKRITHGFNGGYEEQLPSDFSRGGKWFHKGYVSTLK